MLYKRSIEMLKYSVQNNQENERMDTMQLFCGKDVCE